MDLRLPLVAYHRSAGSCSRSFVAYIVAAERPAVGSHIAAVAGWETDIAAAAEGSRIVAAAGGIRTVAAACHIVAALAEARPAEAHPTRQTDSQRFVAAARHRKDCQGPWLLRPFQEYWLKIGLKTPSTLRRGHSPSGRPRAAAALGSASAASTGMPRKR